MTIRTGFLLIFLGLFFQTALFSQPKAGQQAPEVALPGVDGHTRKLSDLTGKVVLLDFWASWCGPCRRSNPALVQIYEKYRAKGFEIFSISIDDSKAAWVDAISADKLTWTQVNEAGGGNGSVATTWGIQEIPYSFLLDRSGKIVAVDLRSDQVEKKLVTLLKQ